MSGRSWEPEPSRDENVVDTRSVDVCEMELSRKGAVNQDLMYISGREDVRQLCARSTSPAPL